MVDLTFNPSPVVTRSAPSRLLEIISHTTDGVYAVDETHRIILWNAGAHRILGFSADEMLGQPCYEVVAGRDERGNLVCQGGCLDMTLAKAGSLVPTKDVLTRNKDGNQIWVNITNIPVPSELGGLSCVVHIFREVTAQRNTEQLVQRLASLMESFSVAQVARPRYGAGVLARHRSLTPRERHVLRLLAEGSNAASIAQALAISPATVRKHIQNLLKKLNVHTALEAVAYSSRHNLFGSPTP